jgi:very-short-patch-repair endonuclease
MPVRPSDSRVQLLQARAHGLRKQPTASEALLWSALRGRRLGVAFRRQCVIGRFMVDFVAPEVPLVVEVDRGYHAERRRADQRRDGVLARLGHRVCGSQDSSSVTYRGRSAASSLRFADFEGDSQSAIVLEAVCPCEHNRSLLLGRSFGSSSRWRAISGESLYSERVKPVARRVGRV